MNLFVEPWIEHSARRNIKFVWNDAGVIPCLERVRYRNELDVPKTRHSVRKVALPDGLSADIAAWRSMTPSVAPDAWVFPSETLKTPLNRDNVWRRSIGPKLKDAGPGWVNFQVMRRTHSTLMNQLKVEPKLVADQLGHTLDVNQNVYTIPDLALRQEAVNRLEGAVQNA